jgi:hypothetical protein
VLEISEADHVLMDSPGGRAAIAAVRQHLPESKVIHPQMNLEIDVVPIDPDTHLLRAMRAGAAGLSARRILTIYPEGQRSFDGELQEFKKGAAICPRK